LIEAGRHADHLPALTAREAASLGRVRTALTQAIHAELGVEVVFAAVIGRNVTHFHEHLSPRYPGTPNDVPWDQSDKVGPQGDGVTVTDLALRLRRRVGLEVAAHSE
jgi:diadenosine tetraphosphate (Ap4A) HIT family hydrolase